MGGVLIFGEVAVGGVLVVTGGRQLMAHITTGSILPECNGWRSG